MEIIVIQPGGHLRLNLKSSNPSITTQGRLRCKQDVPYPVVQVHTPLHGVPRLSNNHRNGPPRKSGQRPHAFVDRPKSLTPSIDPRLGASSQHKELHRCALWRIFRPAFRNGGLTRILHHSLLVQLYHITM